MSADMSADMIDLLHVADFTVEVGEPFEVGPTPAGVRRMIPILGGEGSGPRIQGRVLAGGADFQILRNNGATELHARCVVECESGAGVRRPGRVELTVYQVM